MARSDLLLVQSPKHLNEVHLYIAYFSMEYYIYWGEITLYLALASGSIHKCFFIQLIKIGDQDGCAKEISFT